MRWTVGVKIGSGFALVSAILLIIGTVSFRSINKLIDTADWVTHTHKVLENLGGVVKDPLRGLVDFYGHVEGQLVWLCWKYGETEVSHYHGLEEGFPGRKAILQAVRERLLN